MEGDDRSDAALVARFEHSSVVIERCPRELTFSRLDPGPLDSKPERRQPKSDQHGDVVAITVIEVAGVAGRLAARSPVDMLPPPPIAVGIPTLDLVRRERGAEKNPSGNRVDSPMGGKCMTPPNFELDNWRRAQSRASAAG